MKIVAYSDCVEHDKWEESWIGPIKEARNTRLTEPSDPQSFSNLLKFCPLCRGQMFEAFRGYKSGQGGEFELHSHITVYECETCEWWQCRDDFSEERDDPNKVESYISHTLFRAVAKAFNVRDVDAPVVALTNELSRKPELVHEIDPRKFEKVAQYVFGAFYNCRCEHVGRSYDEGVDLILVESDEPILVQVKRRQAPNYTEFVSVVREFIGAKGNGGKRRERSARLRPLICDPLRSNSQTGAFGIA